VTLLNLLGSASNILTFEIGVASHIILKTMRQENH